MLVTERKIYEELLAGANLFLGRWPIEDAEKNLIDQSRIILLFAHQPC